MFFKSDIGEQKKVRKLQTGMGIERGVIEYW